MSTFKSNKRQRRAHMEDVKSQCEFNDMNVHCFVHIVDELDLSLNELLKLRAVCKKWDEMITTAICAPKISIHLIFMSKFQNDYKCPNVNYESKQQLWNTGEVSVKNLVELRIFNMTKNSGLLKFLARLFPNIQNLLISKQQFSIKDYQLINIWCEQLTSLTLMFERISPYCSSEGNFCNALNQLTGLRILNILFDGFSPKHWLPLAPTLTRLESFGIQVSYLSQLDILPLLGPDLHCLRIISQYDFCKQFASILKLNQENELSLVQNLTHLTITSFRDITLLRIIFNGCQ